MSIKTFTKIILPVILAFAITLSACKKDTPGSWNSEYLLPIFSTDLTIQNLVPDSLVEADSDSLLRLIYGQTIYEFNLAETLIELPDTGLYSRVSIDSLQLGNYRLNYSLTLEDVTDQLIASGEPANVIAGTLIKNADGTMSSVPALDGLGGSAETFDATDFVQSATLWKGKLDIWVINRFPVAIDSVRFLITNTIGGDTLVNQLIAHIPAKDSVFRQINLAGKTVEGSLTFEVLNVQSPGSTAPVLIDLEDDFELKLRVHSIRASEATAIFPNQELISVTEEITQDLEDVKLTYVSVKTGILRAKITSSIDEGMILKYKLEGAYDGNGNPLVFTANVPAAPTGGVSTINKSIDLTNFSISLTGTDGSKFNTYTQTISATIDSSGELKTITADDSVVVTYDFIEIKPKYIKGYVGNQTISVGPETTPIQVFKGLRSGSIDFEDIKLTIGVENGLGVDGRVILNDFTTVGPSSTTSLVDPSVIGTPINIDAATDFPLLPSYTSISLDESTSNITDLVSLAMNAITYSLDIEVNPGGNDNTYQDFAYFDSRLKVNLDAEVPLSFIANDLKLSDTINFQLAETIEDLEAIQDGTFNMIAYNGYPIETELSLVLYDDFWGVVDTFINHYNIQEGILDDNCHVQESTRALMQIPVDNDRMENLKSATQGVIFLDFSTKSNNAMCNGEYLKIYSYYTMKLKLTAQFNYLFDTNF